MTVIELEPHDSDMADARSFGDVLRDIRAAHNLTQHGLVERVHGGFARSTLANIEAGREAPSERVRDLLGGLFPEWAPAIFDAYQHSRELASATPKSPRVAAMREPIRYAIGGPFVVENLQFVYTFRHSRTPEEIIETRRVRATAPSDSFGLKFHADSPHFEAEHEVLWGGRMARSERHEFDGHTTYLQRVDFGRTIARGQRHDFAIRHWVGRDPDPDTRALFTSPLAAKEVSIHLKFLGPTRPKRLRRVGPFADLCEITAQAIKGPEINTAIEISTYFEKPEPGAYYGVIWEW